MNFSSAISQYYGEIIIICCLLAITFPILGLLYVIVAHTISGVFSRRKLYKYVAGKNCLVTGGSKGLGLAICRELVEAGANVLIMARNQRDIDTAVKELKAVAKGRVEGMSCDLTLPDEVKKALTRECKKNGGRN
jgi:3-dehydrosphinganine reductase